MMSGNFPGVIFPEHQDEEIDHDATGTWIFRLVEPPSGGQKSIGESWGALCRFAKEKSIGGSIR